MNQPQLTPFSAQLWCKIHYVEQLHIVERVTTSAGMWVCGLKMPQAVSLKRTKTCSILTHEPLAAVRKSFVQII